MPLPREEPNACHGGQGYLMRTIKQDAPLEGRLLLSARNRLTDDTKFSISRETVKVVRHHSAVILKRIESNLPRRRHDPPPGDVILSQLPSR